MAALRLIHRVVELCDRTDFKHNEDEHIELRRILFTEGKGKAEEAQRLGAWL